MTLGEKIKLARGKKNLSQEELAEKLGVSRQAVSKWENDNALPQGINRELMSQVLGVDLSSFEIGNSSENKVKNQLKRSAGLWRAAVFVFLLLAVITLVVLLFISKNNIEPEDSEVLTESVTIEPEVLTESVTIEGLTFGSMYEELSMLGDPKAITPIQDEAVVMNKGYFVTAEYEGLTATLSAGTNFILTESSNIYSLTALSDAYTDSKGLKVGDSKEKLMRQYNLYEHELIRAGEYEEEYEELYRIHNDGIAAHELPDYDFFFAADNGESPVVLIYLIRDDCINGILLRHLTAG